MNYQRIKPYLEDPFWVFVLFCITYDLFFYCLSLYYPVKCEFYGSIIDVRCY